MSKLVVKASSLNLREEPSLTAKIVKTLDRNEITTKGEWICS